MIVLIGLSFSYLLERSEYEKTMKDSYGNKAFYKIVYDGDINDLFENVFEGDSILNVKSAFEQLVIQDDYQYSYSDVQGIFFVGESNIRYKEECELGYETGESVDDYVALKAIYADKLFFEKNTLKLSSGTPFTEEDFYIESDENVSIPVILGSAYSGLYKIGDEISNANFWCEVPITLVVQGFFEQDSYFYDNNNQKVLLNRYMTVPSIEVSEEFSDDYFLKGAYNGIKLMNARVICDEADENEVISKVNAILNENQLYDFYLFDESDGASRILESSKEFTFLGLLITAITLIVCTIMLILGVFSKLLKEIKNYSIYILLGFSKAKIFIFVILETLLIFIPSNIIGLIIFGLMKAKDFDEKILDPVILLTILISEIVVIIISEIIAVYKIYNTDLSSSVRQKE